MPFFNECSITVLVISNSNGKERPLVTKESLISMDNDKRNFSDIYLLSRNVIVIIIFQIKNSKLLKSYLQELIY